MLTTASKPRPSLTEPTEPTHESRFLSVKTLSEQWECARSTVSRLLDAAGVQAYYFGRGRTGSKRYLKDDIDRYLQQIDRA